MPRNTTFYDEAISCVDRHKQKFKNEGFERYVDTLYVAVDQDNKVKYSLSPSILYDGTKFAILIHKKSRIAETNWYSWYDVETINQELEVKSGMLDDNFRLDVNYEGHFQNQWMALRAEGIYPNLIFKCKWPAECQLQVIWDVYQKCLECETAAEAQLLGKLAMTDQNLIKQNKDLANESFRQMLLTAERDQYKSMLDEIRTMVDSLKKI